MGSASSLTICIQSAWEIDYSNLPMTAIRPWPDSSHRQISWYMHVPALTDESKSHAELKRLGNDKSSPD